MVYSSTNNIHGAESFLRSS